MTRLQRPLAILIAILVLACLVRVAAVLIMPVQFLPDAQTYRTAAADLLGGNLIVSHLVMPFYPAVIAVFGGGRIGQIVVDIVTSTGSVALVWLLARLLFRDVLASHLAALMLAFYPLSIFYAATGLSEGFFTALVLAAFLALYRNAMLMASILFVLSIMTRPALDLFVPVVIIWTTLVIHREGLLRAVRHTAVYAAVYVVLMAPWWAHNMAKFDTFVRLNLGAGATLYAGNNPMNKTGGGITGEDADLRPFYAIHDPVERDKAYKDAAIDFIRNNPGQTVNLAWLKFKRFWSVLPFAQEYSSNPAAKFAALSLLPILVLAVATFIAQWRRFWFFSPVLGLFAYLTLVHMVTIGSIRYRFPLEPFLIVFAAPSLAWIAARVPGLAALAAWAGAHEKETA